MEEVTALPVEPDKAESPAEPKGSKNFTAEERATIISKAKEVGFEKVAKEFGIRARLISYWIQQEKKKASKATKPSKPLKRTKTKGKASKLDAVEHIAEDVSTVPTEPTKAIELVIADKPVKRIGRKAEKSEEKQTLVEKPTDGLMIENAILKERIALLNKEIEKLRTALTSLM